MGFNVQKTLTAEKDGEIKIRLVVNVTYEDLDDSGKDIAPESLEVFHIFRLPTTTEREKYNQMMVKVKGMNLKSIDYNEATFWLWKQCIVRITGYDGLPEVKAQYINVFEESIILRIHAERAIEALLSHINTSEQDIAKK